MSGSWKHSHGLCGAPCRPDVLYVLCVATIGMLLVSLVRACACEARKQNVGAPAKFSVHAFSECMLLMHAPHACSRCMPNSPRMHADA
eukprot:360058-Chlamydomonas_euryale.AAC.5